MSYGTQIRSIGLENGTLEEMQTARMVRVLECRAWSGSVTVSEYDADEGFFFASQIGTSGGTFAALVPRMVFNNTTKVFSWSDGGIGNLNDGTWSRNFNVMFFSSIPS
ncbi:hypothetical protein EOK75_17125 (plasmid) [Pseudorhodobacter turbinis]|uniref:Uncharacterized protein n=1 Tax=Pseudorhodobacter turbinis TaxID=2500533 RepID=A0A4P8EK49_9RHOB|nr:hypothetical protein [Pseudorhodobacter turbinis]QCO57436.1 hypothetical protein EOK75_17125 [Pseudorhodobacter turbinis]